MEEAFAIEREASAHLEVIATATAAGLARGDQGVKGVQDFYAGGVVLITGGSGYVGKHLLEKLFRSCEIRKAYLLLREKNGKSIVDRFSEILKDQAFNSLHADQPDFKQRIVLVEGDVGQVGLGLSGENWRDITENVSVIFHVAATVKFDETLKTAALINVRGTREVLRLAKDCTQLKSFVHVSTAYSHTTAFQTDADILEQFYSVPVSPDFLIHMVETFQEYRIEEMTAKIIHGWPNTYSFTKAVAEELVRTVGAGLPVCIVRPAIVISAYREPLPGWTDKSCIHGTTGVYISHVHHTVQSDAVCSEVLLKKTELSLRVEKLDSRHKVNFSSFMIGLSLIMGLNHVILADRDAAINLIPVDYVNNAIIVAATTCGKEMTVYNVSCDRSFLWAHCGSIFNKILSKLPSPKIIGDGFAFMTSNLLVYKMLTVLLHYIPAGLVDICSVLVGGRPWMTKLYKRIYKLSQVLRYFTCKNWIFDDKNTQALYHNLSETDKKIFTFDRNTIDVPEMMILWAIGLRRFVLKDQLKGTDVGKKKQVIFRLITIGMFLFYFIVLFCLIKFLLNLLF